MKHHISSVVFVVILLAWHTETVCADEWLGPNLVSNGNFSAGNQGWTGMGISGQYWTFGGDRAIALRQATWADPLGISQIVNIQNGKRYRISGQSYAYSPPVASKYRTYISFGSQLTAGYWRSWYESESQVLTTKTDEGILNLPAGNAQFTLVFEVISSYDSANPQGVFDNVGMYQVVYSPDVSISQGPIRINSDAPNGSSTSVSLTLNNHTEYADELTSWSMDWGDGLVQQNPALNSSYGHSYSIGNPSDTSQTWNAVLSGTNQAGTDLETVPVTVLRQPAAFLEVNGNSVLDGETIEVDIFNDPILDLSLLNSLGYTEGASLVIDGLLDQAGMGIGNFTYSGNLFDESNLGQTYSLTVGVYNTGLGVNSNYLNIDLSIVPEPTTALFTCLGALMIRKRK